MSDNKNEKTIQEIYDTLTEEQKKSVNLLIGAALDNNPKILTGSRKELKKVINTMTKEQKEMMAALVGLALDEEKEAGKKQ